MYNFSSDRFIHNIFYSEIKIIFKTLQSIIRRHDTGIERDNFYNRRAGDLYLYDNWASYWFGFDTIAHFTIPAIFTVIAAMLYELVRIRKRVPNAVEVLLISGLTVVIFSFLWELFEKQSDIWWGTKLFWNPDRPIAVDTADDLIADFYGAFVGSVLIFRSWTGWNKKWLKNKV